MQEDKKEPVKTTLTENDLKNLVNILANTPTQNLTVAQELISLSNKISKILSDSTTA